MAKYFLIPEDNDGDDRVPVFGQVTEQPVVAEEGEAESDTNAGDAYDSNCQAGNRRPPFVDAPAAQTSDDRDGCRQKRERYQNAPRHAQ